MDIRWQQFSFPNINAIGRVLNKPNVNFHVTRDPHTVRSYVDECHKYKLFIKDIYDYGGKSP